MKNSGFSEEVVAMRERTKQFALRVTRMYGSLPGRRLDETLGHQAFRSATSVGAHYREACRARSNAEIISKLESLLQELDETSYWLELLVDSNTVSARKMSPLRQEADELTRMIVTSVKNIKSRQKRRDHPSSLIPHP